MRPGLVELVAVEVLMGESVSFLASEIGVPLLVLLADYGVALQLAAYVDLTSKWKNFKLYHPFLRKGFTYNKITRPLCLL